MIEDSEEVWEKRDKAPEVGGGVVAPPAIRERDKSYSVRGLSVINYRSARIIKGNSNFSYPAPAQRKWLVVEGLKFFLGVFMAVETDCPNSF